MENVLILQDIRSIYNVGAIFRTADAIGISKIYLCGVTPAPIDRFGRKRDDLAKTALGAEESVSWGHVKDIISLIKDLKEKGFQIISLEQSENSIDYKKVSLKDKNAFILGEEVNGIPKNILEISDVISEIPMKGEKESLNVSVATGIFLFRLLD